MFNINNVWNIRNKELFVDKYNIFNKKEYNNIFISRFINVLSIIELYNICDVVIFGICLLLVYKGIRTWIYYHWLI